MYKKHFASFGNGGFGPVGKAAPSSLSPNTEVLIENVKRTLEDIKYGILKPEESEEEKNYKGNKDKINSRVHFYNYLNKLGISVKR